MWQMHRDRLAPLVAAALFFAATASLSLVAQQAPAPASSPAAPRGDKARGRMLFTKDACFQCHANEAQGSATGPRIGPDPLPFARFAAYLRAPRGDMPPYTAKVLSDQDLADIYAFLQAQPRPKPLDTIPLLAP